MVKSNGMSIHLNKIKIHYRKVIDRMIKYKYVDELGIKKNDPTRRLIGKTHLLWYLLSLAANTRASTLMTV